LPGGGRTRRDPPEAASHLPLNSFVPVTSAEGQGAIQVACRTDPPGPRSRPRRVSPLGASLAGGKWHTIRCVPLPPPPWGIQPPPGWPGDVAEGTDTGVLPRDSGENRPSILGVW
jgi:hypothetical protein